MPRWQPITDLPEDWEKLRSSHLEGLLSIWRERYEKLKDSTALAEFNARLQREWAIETGIIEGLYTIDRGTTQLLIEKGIVEDLLSHGSTNRPVPQVIGLLKDHQEVLEGVFDFISQRRDLSTSYIKEVHAALTRHQDTVTGKDTFGNRFETPLLRGEWKRLPNNPTRDNGGIHEYCPPEHTAAEMDRLVAMHRQHQEQGVPPEIEAAWLHHRFTQIHPFQDGNGRVARLLASLIFLRAGGFPVSVHRDTRAEYIEALEKADDGDLSILVELFGRLQAKAVEQAISVEEPIRDFDEMLEVITERLSGTGNNRDSTPERVFSLARLLASETKAEFQRIQQKWEPSLVNALGQAGFSLDVDSFIENSAGTISPIYRAEVSRLVEERGYIADAKSHWNWVRLHFTNNSIQLGLVVAFCGFGDRFSGILAALAFVEQMPAQFGAYSQRFSITEDIFTFNYQESEPELRRRFGKWLSPVILTGLDQWRRLL